MKWYIYHEKSNQYLFHGDRWGYYNDRNMKVFDTKMECEAHIQHTFRYINNFIAMSEDDFLILYILVS
jgi:hypothetical protein